MKKIKLNAAKLQLNKEKVVNLTNDQLMLVGGADFIQQGPGNAAAFTGGCTDGQLCHSAWNCTRADCSNDCPLLASKMICPSTETSVQSRYC
jgi:hypothetical protein